MVIITTFYLANFISSISVLCLLYFFVKLLKIEFVKVKIFSFIKKMLFNSFSNFCFFDIIFLKINTFFNQNLYLNYPLTLYDPLALLKIYFHASKVYATSFIHKIILSIGKSKASSRT